MQSRPRLTLIVSQGTAPRRHVPIGVGNAGMSKTVKRSFVLASHRTSVSLEEGFWAALNDMARRERVSVAGLVARIDDAREGNLSSAIRVFVLNDFRSSAGLSALPAARRAPAV